MRLFTSLTLSAQEKTKIFHWRENHLNKTIGAIPQQNFHITLAFLGDVNSKDLCQLATNIDLANQAIALKPFTLKLDQVCFWPKTGIVWLGPSDWPIALSKLANKHQTIASKLGVKKPKHAYQPHVSLMREVQEFKAPFPNSSVTTALNINIGAISLYESSASPSGGRHYSTVEHWPLKAFY